MILSVRNAGKDSIQVGFQGAQLEPNYDFVVLDSDSTIVWNRLPGAIPLALPTRYFAPGETKTFEGSWGLTDEEGTQVESNTYYVFGGFRGLQYTNPETSEEFNGRAATEMQQIVIE